MLAVTETGIPFEAATDSPSIDTKRQEKTSPAKRLATRKGSSAENRAIMEKRGMSRKAISRDMERRAAVWRIRSIKCRKKSNGPLNPNLVCGLQFPGRTQ